MALKDHPRWGWLSKHWMLPMPYRLAVFAAGIVAVLLADVPIAALVFVLGVGLLTADYLWWRRYAPR